MTTIDIDAIRQRAEFSADPFHVEDVDALLAKVDELTAELAKARKDRDEYADDNTRVAAALIDVQRKLAGAEADNQSLRKGHDAYANENARLRPVVEAAKAWRAEREAVRVGGGTVLALSDLLNALAAAVDALPKAEVAR
ncbi:hypothetical protein [Micromonospora sp. URMC 103]|uniref:hypothetical protein n=1 Tax=Micromonospora sp. URMC 103 TaxID=3423406 RepID=UPI003F19582F